MVRTFCTHPEAFHDCCLLIGGNGPDEGPLKQLIAECPRGSDITLRPWQDDVESFYGEIDVLMLPSRYEGVPLVMLEALARGIPVIGSARDGMKDILPESWTFEPENEDSLVETFSKCRHSWQNDIAEARIKIETEMTIEAFKAAFHRAVVQA